MKWNQDSLEASWRVLKYFLCCCAPVLLCRLRLLYYVVVPRSDYKSSIFWIFNAFNFHRLLRLHFTVYKTLFSPCTKPILSLWTLKSSLYVHFLQFLLFIHRFLAVFVRLSSFTKLLFEFCNNLLFFNHTIADKPKSLQKELLQIKQRRSRVPWDKSTEDGTSSSRELWKDNEN